MAVTSRLSWGDQNSMSAAVQQPQLPLSRRWPVLFWLGVIFCFFIFPIFLVDIGLDSLLVTRHNLQKQEIFRKLNSNLEQLVQFKNSRHYYHALLKRIFEIAVKQKDPFVYLQKALPHLKKRNPDTFKFIVWGQKGNIIDNLTDEKGYRYIVKTLFEVFSDIAKDCQSNYPGTPENLQSVEKKLNLLRSYLGAFIIPEKLNLPLFRGNLGELVLATSDPEKSHFWFQCSEKFTMMAHINADAIESTGYLKKLVLGINGRKNSQIRCGIAELVKDKGIYTGFSHPNAEELLIEVGKFQNFSEPQMETPHFLVSVRMLSPFIIAFSFINKEGNMVNADSQRRAIIGSIAGIIILLSATFLYFVFYRNQIISIRLKLALLFIYANGLPLMILGFLGYEYLQQTRRLLLDQAREQIATLVTDFDSKYETIPKQYANQLNQIVTGLNQQIGNRPLKASDFKDSADSVLVTRPYDFMVADKDGKLIQLKSIGSRASSFYANMSRNLLNFVNISSFTPQELFRDDMKSSGGKGSIKAESFLSGKTIVFNQFLRRLRKIHFEQMGSSSRMFYWNLLGNFARREFHNVLVVSWHHETLQENYISQSFAELGSNFGQFKFYAIIESNGMTYPVKEQIDREVFNLFRQTFSLKAVFADDVEVSGEHYAAFGTIGKQLDKVAMVGLIPLENIDSQINEIRLRLIVFALLSLSLTFGIGRLLSSQFMGPVKELEKGVQAIGRQDFRYRLPVNSADEFGHLSNVFNSAIESLEDLEIAKVVQENLFPQENLRQNGIEIFGRSVAMTRLGGDYYDFFPINDEMVGVLMGDVAGHGIPAALLMAMAKASVLLTGEEKCDPALMLSSLHRVIHRVKSSKIKRMMTCQYFCINSKTGDYSVSNAGHCFPAVIRGNGQEVELVKLIGTPLGITKKPKYDNTTLKLESGDVVLLYTDGIIESQNSEGKDMGFDNFSRILAESFDENLEKYYDRVFKAYKDWSADADDDITMVLIRYHQEGEKT